MGLSGLLVLYISDGLGDKRVKFIGFSVELW